MVMEIFHLGLKPIGDADIVGVHPGDKVVRTLLYALTQGITQPLIGPDLVNPELFLVVVLPRLKNGFESVGNRPILYDQNLIRNECLLRYTVIAVSKWSGSSPAYTGKRTENGENLWLMIGSSALFENYHGPLNMKLVLSYPYVLIY